MSDRKTRADKAAYEDFFVFPLRSLRLLLSIRLFHAICRVMTMKTLLVGVVGALFTCSSAMAADAGDKRLAEILGGDAGGWRISRYSGAADDYTLKDEVGRPVLVSGPNATV